MSEFSLNAGAELHDEQDSVLKDTDYFTEDSLMDGAVPELNADTELYALTTRKDALEALISRVQDAGGMCLAYAQEALQIAPELDLAPSAYFTKHVTGTQYQPALEAMVCKAANMSVQIQASNESVAANMKDFIKKLIARIIAFFKACAKKIKGFFNGKSTAEIKQETADFKRDIDAFVKDTDRLSQVKEHEQAAQQKFVTKCAPLSERITRERVLSDFLGKQELLKFLTHRATYMSVLAMDLTAALSDFKNFRSLNEAQLATQINKLELKGINKDLVDDAINVAKQTIPVSNTRECLLFLKTVRTAHEKFNQGIDEVLGHVGAVGLFMTKAEDIIEDIERAIEREALYAGADVHLQKLLQLVIHRSNGIFAYALELKEYVVKVQQFEASVRDVIGDDVARAMAAKESVSVPSLGFEPDEPAVALPINFAALDLGLESLVAPNPLNVRTALNLGLESLASSVPVPASEGLMDSFLGLFKQRVKDAPRDEVKQIESNYAWIRNNIQNGQLKPGLTLREGAITVSGAAAKFFYRDGKAITNIGAEFKSDAQTLYRLYTQSKPKFAAVGKIMRELDQATGKIPAQQITFEQLAAAVRRFKGRLPAPIPNPLDNSSLALLGASKGSVSSVTFEHIDQAQLNALVKLAAMIADYSLEVYLFADELPMGIDFTDPPYRAFTEELFEDRELASILNPLGHPDYDDNYRSGIDEVEGRLTGLDDALWSLIRACVTTQ